ncbi:MAG TPA: GWxTD domain-containing protein, partial [Terriglobales bacterium]|nr:GWxTD domain-containing protein [Terriglobales bacterium]
MRTLRNLFLCRVMFRLTSAAKVFDVVQLSRRGPVPTCTVVVLSMVFILAEVVVPVRANEKLPVRYRKWLEEEVVYIITKEEKDVFLRLTQDEDRDKFIQRFWDIRNLLPGSPSNEYREGHYRRLAYTDQHFGNEAGLGWRTDRGRVYITLGPPEQKAVYYGFGNLRPMEIWFYSGTSPALPPFFYVVFYQRENIGDYRLYSPYFDGPNKLVTSIRGTNNRVSALKIIEQAAGSEVARTTLSLIPDEPVDMQGATSSLQSDVLLSTIRNLANHPLARADLDRRRQLLENVTARLILEGQTLDVLAVPLRDSQGETRCHYVVRLRRPQDLTVGQTNDGRYYYSVEARVRVLGSDNKLIFVQEKSVSQSFDQSRLKQVQDKVFGYEGWLPLPPGKYKLDFLLTDWLRKAGYHAEKDVVIPKLTSGGMLISGVVPFSDAEMVDPARSDLLPFTMAGVKFTPLLGQQLNLSPQQSLNVVYQIWAVPRDPHAYEGQKLNVEYAFGRPASPGDTKAVQGQIGKEQFDATGSLVNGKKISLEGLPPGNYLLTVTLTEPGSPQRAHGTLNFRVLGEPASTPSWDVFDETLGEDLRKGIPEYQRALCYLTLGQQEDAAMWFRRTLEKDASSEQARARLVDFYFARQNFRDVAELYSRGGITGHTPEQTILRMAESLDKIGETKRASALLETAVKL